MRAKKNHLGKSAFRKGHSLPIPYCKRFDKLLAYPLFMSSPTRDPWIRDQSLDSALRPSVWGEYVGQGHVKANVTVVLEAAKKRGDMPENFLFYGPPGV